MAKPSWCSATGTTYFAPASLKSCGPRVGVVFGDGEEGDEVLVAELVGWAVVLGVPGHVGGVHVLDVPLVDARGDGVKAPVDEDAELGLVEPGGGAVVVADGGPGGFEGAVDIGLGLGVGVGRAGGGAGLCVEGAGEESGGRGEEGGLSKESAAGEGHRGKGILQRERFSTSKLTFI